MSLDLKHHHGAASVPDLDESIAWYGRVLGFEVEQRFFIPPIPAEVAMLRRGDLRVELFMVKGAKAMDPDRRIPDRDVHTLGNKHTAFAVKDARATADELRARGADIAFVVDMEHGRAVFIRDNAGNLIEFVEEPSLWASPAPA
jgi:methylmalonyl-CoA/ethylmalonyl-CoA epimerase